MINEPHRLEKESVLRVGEVAAVTGRKVFVEVDRDKNLSELFFDGDVLRNVAVGSYIDIRKGFISLIGKVEGENAQVEGERRAARLSIREGRRLLAISLVGFLDRSGVFFGGTRELPLVGNEAFLLTKEKVHQVHNLVSAGGPALDIAVSEYEGYDIAFPIDGLINSHIAIFGNTGSGKSNTLAIIFREFVRVMQNLNRTAFEANCRVIILDFNSEYTAPQCITPDKTVYNLSTRHAAGDRLPLGDADLLDIEMLGILADATEKTQRPFLRRTLALRRRVMDGGDALEHFRNILRSQIKQILQMSEKPKADLLLDYLRQILPEQNAAGELVELAADLVWHNMSSEFRCNGVFLKSNPDAIEDTVVYQHVEQVVLSDDLIDSLIAFCYVQLIYDVLSNRAVNEHIAPVIHRLKSKQADIRRIFDTAGGLLFTNNVVVVSLSDVNLDMKKTIPLLLIRKIYHDHKQAGAGKSLNIIVDEAHNILSHESSRESESWKDYRLETFEEIIKEGRKFGVFVTIASQRPNDISQTITSQAHNYFIHRLINQRDLQSIASAVSYIDKLTEESIPTLPTGTCIFSGVAGQMPLKVTIKALDEELRPRSATLRFADIVPDIFA